MRCRECNIDLPENYTACPLCAAKTHPDAHKIKGIRYSECPKVKTEKYKPSAFPVFLILWAVSAVAGLALQHAGILDAVQTALVCSVVPLLWTAIGRPLFVKQLYVGNYIMMNIWSLTFAAVILGKAFDAQADGFATGVPIACLSVLIALFTIVLVHPKDGKRAASYPVLTGVGSVIALVAVGIKFNVFAPLWLGVLAVSALLLAFILCKYKDAAKQELKAKFTIQ